MVALLIEPRQSLHGGSLEITLTVPLNSAFHQVNVLLIVYLIVVVFLIFVLEVYYVKIHSDVKLLFNH